MLADDAVLIGPVSGLKFPANREINREIGTFGLCCDLASLLFAIGFSDFQLKFPRCGNREFSGRIRDLQSKDQRMVCLFKPWRFTALFP
jgi:hypothetical protein